MVNLKMYPHPNDQNVQWHKLKAKGMSRLVGMRYAYIKPRTLFLNGEVERSHKTDQQDFYQLLKYPGDIDLKEKLKTWKNFYNFDRPHGAFSGKIPCEILVEKMQIVFHNSTG